MPLHPNGELAMIFHWVTALALGLGIVPAAPLPEGLAASGEAKARGLYAESKFGRIDVNQALEQLEADWAGRGVAPKVEGRALLWKGKRRLYRSLETIAVFEDAPTIKADAEACTAQISLARSVRVTAATSDGLLAAGWIREHPKCGRFIPRCTDETAVGVKGRCVNLGGGRVGSSR